MKYRWPLTPLGEILTERREVPSSEDIESGRIRIVKKISFDSGRIQLRLDGSTKTGMIQVRPGDLLLSGINAAKGAIAIYDESAHEPIAATIHYGAYIPKRDRVSIQFLWRMLRSRFFQDLLLEFVPGGIKTELKAKRFLPVPVPLPPLAEQRRIVARIKELAAQITETRTLRQQAMKETEGITYSLLNQFFLKLQHEMNPMRLDCIGNCRLGKMLNPKAKTGVGLTPYLRNANIQWGYLDLRSVYKMDFKDLERKEFELKAGDILVCEGGDIGKAAIWNDEIPGCCYQKALHRIRCDSDRAIPRFLLYHFFWAAHEGHWLGLKTQTTIPHLTGIKLKAYPVYVPSLQEQCRIVAELDALQAEVDALKRLQAETTAEFDALLPSILDRAFKGGI